MASYAVIDAFTAMIGAAWPHTPIMGLNESGKAPSENSAFLTVTFPVAKEEQASVGAPGANIYREEGAAHVCLAIPIGLGINPPDSPWAQRIDALRAALRGKTFADGAGVTWEASPPFVNEQSDRGAYFEMSFAVPYRYDVAG
ncbi:MAG: hypothetical protein CTY36_00115 [Methylocystis sp.]|nr:hypothetical protein [Accumulibacter sp.]PPD10335.1 MAG: hypothetical protein CTY36_00115 [Methylocystis sp.]